MTGLSDFAYAQVRLQSRYSQRADEHVWQRLRNINDFASYLQVAQQTPLRPWVLGIGSDHDSHEIEFALRQKYRQHVDEVANWIPADWKIPLQWIKRLADLPTLQYLLAGGIALNWMKSDPDISKFTVDDSALRLQAMSAAGCVSLVNAWQQGDAMFTGWLSYWKQAQPQKSKFNNGLQTMENLLHQHMLLQAKQLQSKQADVVLPTDYEVITNSLRIIFRRYAFQPAAVCAYLAIIAVDIHRIRSDLMQRLLFQSSEDFAQELPV